ncbi:cellulase family glycosylhydrolase [uncultured Victivallis sp.]|uniref:glycoside hydrolase family 5 protein n=1 Tax=uncultured Victivallis sp. TaxID=354118 RepID=UPI00258F79DF|nr:cellulase family glycosylhydrolase [uncultured Victivallis sp.]
MKIKLGILAALLAGSFGAAGGPAGDCGLAQAEWKLGTHSRLEERDGKRLLVVEVPEKDRNGSYLSRAEIDLSPFRGLPTTFSMRVRIDGIEKEAGRKGIKFMVTYQAPSGAGIWHGGWGIYGPADWRSVSFLSPIDDYTGKAELVLGVEKNFGKVEFDLDSFRAENHFDLDQSSARAVYTDRVLKEKRLRGVMSPGGNMTEDDFRTLREWGANLVRFQMQRLYQDCTDLDAYGRWLKGRLDHFEKLTEIAPRYGIRLILDLHSAPGGRRSDSAELLMLHSEEYAQYFVRVWEEIARRFKGNPAVFAYDLVNEPYQTGAARFDYLELQKRAAEAIRRIDPEVPIIVEANQLAAPVAFRYFRLLELPNIVYQAHMYVPESFTHQNTPGSRYPGVISGIEWNKEQLRHTLEPVRRFQQRHGARIYIGEFSAKTWAPGAERYIADCISLFEEYGWDWSYHAFREARSWNVELEGTQEKTVPSADNPRKKALLEGLGKNLVTP